MSAPLVTVFICTRDPDLARLRRVLDALRAQTLPAEAWELLILDNASTPALDGRIELGRHRNAQLRRVDTGGKSTAMLAAIAHARAPLLVMVDDDNILASDYLQQALEIANRRPELGAWGGQLIGQWEAPLPPRLALYRKYLAVREFDQDRWSNWPQDGALPVGAGLCFRRSVGEAYAAACVQTPARLRLGPGPDGFGMCEDLDLIYCAFDLGLGVGLFRALRVEHVIAAARVEEKYLEAYAERCAASHSVFNTLRPPSLALPFQKNAPPLAPDTWLDRLIRSYQQLRAGSVARRHDRAAMRGLRRGVL